MVKHFCNRCKKELTSDEIRFCMEMIGKDLCHEHANEYLSALPKGWTMKFEPEYCHADTDGECYWGECPQTRDGEPMKTGRHCPLDIRGDDE